jgi:hypothetical protein
MPLLLYLSVCVWCFNNFCTALCAKVYFYSRVLKSLVIPFTSFPQYVEVAHFVLCCWGSVCMFCFCGCGSGFWLGLCYIRYFVVCFNCAYFCFMSRDSVVSIATGYGLDDRGVGVWVPVGSRFSLLHVVHTGSGVNPTSYPMGYGGSFPGGEAAEAWSWQITSSQCRGQENVDLYIHSSIGLHGVVLN